MIPELLNRFGAPRRGCAALSLSTLEQNAKQETGVHETASPYRRACSLRPARPHTGFCSAFDGGWTWLQSLPLSWFPGLNLACRVQVSV